MATTTRALDVSTRKALIPDPPPVKTAGRLDVARNRPLMTLMTHAQRMKPIY